MADPWFKFYPSDWLGGTRGLTAAETGIYVTLIAMMYERRAPIDMDMTRLARLCGCPAGSFKRAMEGLIEAGKIIRTERGLWNTRVEIEIQDREVASRNGSDAAQSRWRKGKEKAEQNQSCDDASASSAQCEIDAMPEARSQKEDSDANASDGEAVDFAKQLFDRGVQFLGKHGTPEVKARRMIGLWRKDHPDPEIFDAFSACSRAGAVDPIPWITARLGGAKVDIRAMMKEIGNA